MITLHQRFIKKCSRYAKSIVRKTGGEYTEDDVKGELWITASSLQEQGSLEIDFNNPEHQGLIRSYTHQRLVRYTEKNLRYAASLDTPLIEGAPNRIERLANANEDNPLDVLDAEQKAAATEAMLAAQGMSLGAAWLVLLSRNSGKIVKVAQFLKLSQSHTYRCYQRVRILAEQQRPLFLEAGGSPDYRIKPWRKFRLYRTPEQLVFEFDSGLELV